MTSLPSSNKKNISNVILSKSTLKISNGQPRYGSADGQAPAVRAVAAGHAHVLVLHADGSARAVGLGGSQVPARIPPAPPGRRYVTVAPLLGPAAARAVLLALVKGALHRLLPENRALIFEFLVGRRPGCTPRA